MACRDSRTTSSGNQRHYQSPISARDARGRDFDLLDDGAPDAALAVFALNLGIHPASPRARQAMGEAHLETGHPEQAIPYLESVLQHDPDNSFVLHTLERLRK